jgi:hypothetical protein
MKKKWEQEEFYNIGRRDRNRGYEKEYWSIGNQRICGK